MTCKTSFLLSSSLPAGDLLWSQIHEGKLGPLLYSSKLKIQDRTPSEAWRGQFRHDYIRSSISHCEYRQQVAHLLAAASARDIPVMVLRGTRLAEQLYGERCANSMRKFGIKYSEHHPHARKVRDAFVAVKNDKDFQSIIDTWYDLQKDWPAVERKEIHGDLIAAGAKL